MLPYTVKTSVLHELPVEIVDPTTHHYFFIDHHSDVKTIKHSLYRGGVLMAVTRMCHYHFDIDDVSTNVTKRRCFITPQLNDIIIIRSFNSRYHCDFMIIEQYKITDDDPITIEYIRFSINFENLADFTKFIIECSDHKELLKYIGASVISMSMFS